MKIHAYLVSMYLRTTRRKNKNGSIVEYFPLAHNERHPVTDKPVAKIIHNFGRTDQLDPDSMVRLCRSSIDRVCGLTVVDEHDPHQVPPETFRLRAELKIKRIYAYGCIHVHRGRIFNLKFFMIGFPVYFSENQDHKARSNAKSSRTIQNGNILRVAQLRKIFI